MGVDRERAQTIRALASIPPSARWLVDEALHEELKKLRKERSMGFERITYRLDFSGTRWAGLEVRARGTTMEESIELQRFLDMGADILRPGDPVIEEQRQRYFALLAEIVIDWNRTDDGEPVPVTAKHVGLEEMSMLTAVTRAYLREVFEVAPPLSQPSSAGEPSEELFQQMEPLSESPPS